MAALGLQQHIHSSIRIDHTSTASFGQRQGIQLHSRQSEWDGACGIHCAAMALTLLGRLKGTAKLPERRNGAAGRFWKAAEQFYFDGADGSDLANLMSAVDSTLFVGKRSGTHGNLLLAAQRHLQEGRLPLLSWSSKNGQVHHWTLAIGLEGIVSRSRLRHSAILCLDPSEGSPSMCAYNARIQLPDGSAKYVRYLHGQQKEMPVSLTQIVVVGDR